MLGGGASNFVDEIPAEFSLVIAGNGSAGDAKRCVPHKSAPAEGVAPRARKPGPDIELGHIWREMS